MTFLVNVLFARLFSGWPLFTEGGSLQKRVFDAYNILRIYLQGRPKAPFDIIQKITFNCWNLAQFFCSSLNYCLV